MGGTPNPLKKDMPKGKPASERPVGSFAKDGKGRVYKVISVKTKTGVVRKQFRSLATEEDPLGTKAKAALLKQRRQARERRERMATPGRTKTKRTKTATASKSKKPKSKKPKSTKSKKAKSTKSKSKK
jgi:hypothetical protein